MTQTEPAPAGEQEAPAHRIRIRLAAVMAERGVSGAELAEKVGIHANNISRIKNGHIEGFKLATLSALCRELECQPGDLLTYED